MMQPKFQQPTQRALAQRRNQVPDNLLTRCPVCHQVCATATIGPLRVCPHCGYGWRLKARTRVQQITDGFTEMDAELTVPARFDEAAYRDKLVRAKAATGLQESVLTGTAQLGSQRFGLGVMDPYFLMGSLGVATGEKLARLFDTCTKQKRAVVIFTASGGARMQEGALALMQMAKVSAAVDRHRAAGLLYVTVLTDPTTGGVTASFAMQGDVILSEPRALIGFAGRRVIEQTIQQTPPADFQRAETLLAHGWIDQIIPRDALKATLSQLLSLTGGATDA